MSITTVDNLINALGNSSQSAYIINGDDTVGANTTNIPFCLNIKEQGTHGLIPTPTAAGSGGHIPTSTTGGALITFTNPAPPAQTYLTHFSMGGVNTDPCLYTLYDRVYAASGFSGTVTTAQTITGMPTLTRPGTTGLGLQIVIEYYTVPIGTARAITVQYTNSAGTAGRNSKSVTLANSVRAGALTFCPLQDGDLGVQSIQSVTLALSTGTAGNFGVALYNPIGVTLQSLNSEMHVADFTGTRMPIIQDSAQLVLVGTSPGASGLSNSGFITLSQG